MNESAAKRIVHRLRLLALVAAVLCIPIAGNAQVMVSVTIAPPPIPVYVQPLAPGPNYIWVPGYWAWGPGGYYWVPGTWVLAPYPGALWTPGYWGWNGGVYVWNVGYWGPRVGFYGGINYGFGYTGYGYHGGYWKGDSFYYNQAVNNVNRTVVRNTYYTNVTNVPSNRTSYNGGAGGIAARPTAQDRTYMAERHTAPTTTQLQHERTASSNRALFASENQGRPTIAATPQPGAFDHPARTTTSSAPSAKGAQGMKRTAPNQGQTQGSYSGPPARGQPRATTDRAAPQSGAPGAYPPGSGTQGGAQPRAYSAPQGMPPSRQMAPPSGYAQPPQGGPPQGRPHGPPQAGYPQGAQAAPQAGAGRARGDGGAQGYARGDGGPGQPRGEGGGGGHPRGEGGGEGGNRK